MNLAEAVADLRKRLNLTQQDLAVRLKVAVRTVSVYETGKSPGTLFIVERLRDLAESEGFDDLFLAFTKSIRFLSKLQVSDSVAEVVELAQSIQERLEAIQERVAKWDSDSVIAVNSTPVFTIEDHRKREVLQELRKAQEDAKRIQEIW